MRVTSVRQIGDKIVDILRSAPQPNFGPRGSRHKIYGSQSADCADAACVPKRWRQNFARQIWSNGV